MSEDGPSKGERTRQAILDAAHALFLEQGYHGTSMRQIAGRAGLAVGGIYNHFPGKEDIFDALFMDHHPYQRVLPAVLAAEGETVEQFVRNAARIMVAELGDNPDFLKLMLIEVTEFNGRHMSGLFQTVLPRALPLIQRFQRPGMRLRGISPQVLLRAFISFFFSYYVTELLLGSAMPAAMKGKGVESYVDIFLYGILSAEARA